MRWTITVNDDLAEKIDKFAEEKFMPRSTFMALAAETYMQQSEVMNLLPQLLELAKEESKRVGGETTSGQ